MPMRSFRASPEQLARWDAKAAEQGSTFTAFVHHALDAASEPRRRVVARHTQVASSSCANRVPAGAFCRTCQAVHP